MRDGSDLADFQKIEVHELTRYSTQFPLYACIILAVPSESRHPLLRGVQAGEDVVAVDRLLRGHEPGPSCRRHRGEI